MSNQYFHEPDEPPTVRWVTKRRFEEQQKRIAELEAENKRLRDALEWIERNPASGTEVMRSVAQNALNTTEVNDEKQVK